MCDENQLLRISLRPPSLEALFRTSSSEVAPPSSNSDPHGSTKTAREHSERPIGSRDELYTEIQQPHDATFRIQCARIQLA